MRIGTTTGLLLAALPGSAAVTTSSECYASYDPDGPSLPQIDSETTEGSCAASIVGGSAALNSDGEAGVGFLLARSEANIFDAPRPEDATTYAEVGFRDSIVVTSPGRSGVVTVRGQIFFDGLLDVTGVGVAGMRLRMVATPGSGGQVFLEECSLSSLCFGAFGNYPRIFSEARDVQVNLTLGTTVTFGFVVDTSASRGGSLLDDPGSALVSFGGGGSVAWAGITSVEQSGVPIDYEITSESGTDWTQPVPEPGSLASALAASAAITLRRFARR